ncbi:MAG: amino acid ABC transporter substrate-binding protein [Flavobacteriales bacterium]|nr:MAG: amino acid ABC transporter substrate-binding protein [Flavobacteriales bacterium]
MKKIILLLSLLSSILFFSQKTHTVVKGDNPYRISRTYNIPLSEIYRLNPELKTTPLSIGQVIRLSDKSAKKGSTPSKLGAIIIEPKQTIYGITKKYHISEKELRKLNPNLDNQMKIGDKVALPLAKIKKYAKGQEFVTQEQTKGKDLAKDKIKNIEKPVVPVEKNYNIAEISSDNYLIYKVKSQDTLFGIINSFNVSIEELTALNPQLSKGLKAGMKLKIKKSPTTYTSKEKGVLNIAVIVPLGYKEDKLTYRKMSLEFLKGVRFALERNVAKGKKIKAHFIDGGTGVNFKKSLQKLDKSKANLIIGPFFKSDLFEILSEVTDIPVVAPFSNSKDLYHYPNLIMVQTDEQNYADRIVSEVIKAKHKQKIYIVGDNQYGKYIEQGIKKEYSDANIQIVKSAQNIELSKNMMTGKLIPATLILATKNKKEGQVFANKLVELAGETEGINAYSMYFTGAFENAEKLPALRKAHLVYLMDRKINRRGRFEKEVLSSYKSKYCENEPSKYAVIGFDIVNDMISRENAKAEIFKKIKTEQTQLATKFKFVQAKKGGAYINTGYRVVRLR